MARYMTLLYYPATDEYWASTNAAAQAREEFKTSPEFTEFMAEAMAAGVIRGGEALHSPELSTTITVAGGKGGDVIVTDGPYAEAKEMLGGYFILEVADLDEAIKWAARIPTAWHSKVELRPVVDLQR